MYGLEQQLKQEEKKLLAIQETVRSRLEKAPEGTLRIGKTGGDYPQFMRCFDGTIKSKRIGEYIKKSDWELVVLLAQKAYDKKIKKLVDKRIKQFHSLNEDYKDLEIQKIYEDMSDIRKGLVTPAEPTWEQTIEKWKAVPYTGKGFAEGILEIYTKKGERVRSKSEKIIADTFFEMGIEYKYECPIVLKGYGTVYPDFTIISRKTGKVIYWEHEGRMDDPEYAEKAVRKIDTYLKNGIILGEGLILTFETSNYACSDRAIKKLIEQHLI